MVECLDHTDALDIFDHNGVDVILLGHIAAVHLVIALHAKGHHQKGDWHDGNGRQCKAPVDKDKPDGNGDGQKHVGGELRDHMRKGNFDLLDTVDDDVLEFTDRGRLCRSQRGTHESLCNIIA